METTIIDFIKNDIHNGRGDLTIDPADDLLTSNLLGSMEMVRVIEFIESNFAIKVEPQDMTIDNFITVQAMTDYVKSVRN